MPTTLANRWFSLLICLFGAILVVGETPVSASGEVVVDGGERTGVRVSDAAPRFRVLVFTGTLGARHESIDSGRTMFNKLAEDFDFEVIFSENEAIFNPGTLASFDAIVFLNTSGTVISDERQDTFSEYILGGGGFLGIHAAADTNKGWPWFGDLLGAYFLDHPEVQLADVIVDDVQHPFIADLPLVWSVEDEWYNFEINPRDSVTVLLRLDENSYVGGEMGSDHPIAWCHSIGLGRSFYTGLGHGDALYSDSLFVAHVLRGLEYVALGSTSCSQVPADTQNEFGNPYESNDLSVYPNPSGNMIVLEAGKDLQSSPAVATWRDLLGRVVNTERLQLDGFGKARLHLSGMVSGTYLLTVTSSGSKHPEFVRTTLVTHVN